MNYFTSVEESRSSQQAKNTPSINEVINQHLINQCSNKSAILHKHQQQSHSRLYQESYRKANCDRNPNSSSGFKKIKQKYPLQSDHFLLSVDDFSNPPYGKITSSFDRSHCLQQVPATAVADLRITSIVVAISSDRENSRCCSAICCEADEAFIDFQPEMHSCLDFCDKCEIAHQPWEQGANSLHEVIINNREYNLICSVGIFGVKF